MTPPGCPWANAPYPGIPWLRVNKNGERFGNENLGYQSHIIQVRLQPDMVAWQVTDSNWAVHTSKNDCKHPNSRSRSTADPANDWQSALDRGAIVQADTIEELAKTIGVPEEYLVKTIARCNELCDKGVDEDFGVNGTFMTHNHIKEALFFAIKRMPGLPSICGGLKINKKLEVLNAEGQALGGLYAAG